MNRRALSAWCLIAWCGTSALAQPIELLGLTSAGGGSGAGTLFSFDVATSTIIKKVDFSPAIGTSPGGSLLRASNGKFYGVGDGGANGAGVIFEYDAAAGVLTKTLDLTAAGGSAPRGALIQGRGGLLYGTTHRGGTHDAGVIFQYDIATRRYTKKIDLAPSLGKGPIGALLQAGNGKLYGTTEEGGRINRGTIFEYDPVKNACRKVHDFDSSGGFHPYGAMTEGVPGKLYGGTYAGGANFGGVIYEYDVTSGAYTKKYDFVFSTGRSCFGALLKADNGKLYGLVARGAGNDLGALFEFDVAKNTYIKKVDLSSAIGSHPYGALMQARDGMLYGMTYTGGAGGVGVVFRYDIATNTYTRLADLDGRNGASPMFGHLVEVAALIGESATTILTAYDIFTDILNPNTDPFTPHMEKV